MIRSENKNFYYFTGPKVLSPENPGPKVGSYPMISVLNYIMADNLGDFVAGVGL